MTTEYIKAEPRLTVVSQVTSTRTLDLDSTQVEGIVRLWAQAEAGFTYPEIETLCSWDGMFTGMTLTEVTQGKGRMIEPDDGEQS
jgi:hypothetical protein